MVFIFCLVFLPALQSSPPSAAPPEAKEPVDESNGSDRGFSRDESPPSPGASPPCGDGGPAESQQDLGVLCQTNAPM